MTWQAYIAEKRRLNGNALGPLHHWYAQWLYEQSKITLEQRNNLLDN